MQTLATDTTADHLMDYLASDGAGDEWTYYADLAEWESLYNLLGERQFIGRLARNLASRGLAEIRRTALGMQLRLTPAGIDLAGELEREAACVSAGVVAANGPQARPPENDPDGAGVFGAPMLICVCPESRKRFAVRGLCRKRRARCVASERKPQHADTA